MENFLAHLDFTNFPAYGLIATVILMVLTGRLVPRSTLEDQKEATAKEHKAFLELLEQNAQLVRVLTTTEKVIDSLPKLSEVEPGDDE